jgi:hypothetical protein
MRLKVPRFTGYVRRGLGEALHSIFGSGPTSRSSEEQWDLAIIRDLLAAINTATRKPAGASWRHLIVPVQTDSPYFQVLPVRAEGDYRRLIAEHLRNRPNSATPVITSFAYLQSASLKQPWRLGIAGHYTEQIARNVLAPDSRCGREMPVSHILRCAAVEAGGWAGGWSKNEEPGGFLQLFPYLYPMIPAESEEATAKGQAARPAPRLVMDDSQLSELAELLGYYVDSLEPSSQALVSTPAKVGSFILPRLEWEVGGVFWAGAALFVLIAGIGLLGVPVAQLTRAIVNRQDLMLYRDAEAFLEELSFSSSREASRGVSLYGLSLGGKRTVADRSLTLPGLTSRYQWFVRRICEHYNGKVVIAIDELDKIHDSAQLQGLLSEIKGALFVDGTYYMLSISEDAASSFRKRLSSGRDIFESTFDEIIEIPQMDLHAAEAMLRARIDLGGQSALSPKCDVLQVGTLLAGGIPREILRNFRALSTAWPHDRDAACRMLVSRELTEWIADLANSKLSGAEVVQVRDLAVVARTAVNEGQLEPAFAALDHCLTLIDPKNTRAQARSLELLDGAGEERQRAQSYLALCHDIQSCLRLELLITIGQLVAKGDAIDAFAPRVLEAYAVIQRKAALAETLLSQIRKDMHAGPLLREANSPNPGKWDAEGGGAA